MWVTTPFSDYTHRAQPSKVTRHYSLGMQLILRSYFSVHSIHLG
jgi:hypothetical protein